MNRENTIERLRQETDPWDFIIIGGGATGLGAAADAASRGYRTLLAEREDFAQGTSSRSTKRIHGGVRYLRQGNVSLVLAALRERGRLRANAPHLVRRLGFVIPAYHWREKPFYGVGLKGIFSDGVRRLENPQAKPMLVFSRGSHLVLPREFLPGEHALMVPKTGDGRVLFALPWRDRVLVGTTDGKWTTYRKMAEDVVDRTETVAGFKHRPCVTAHLPLHGAPSREAPVVTTDKACPPLPSVRTSFLTCRKHFDTRKKSAAITSGTPSCALGCGC